MDSDQAKLFVGGICRETTEDVLKDYFSKYGSILSSTISVDRITRHPRGFGFVCFSDLSAADRALQETHVILGRTVEVKKAVPRSEQQHQPQSRGMGNSSSNDTCSDQIRTRKIFVGGLSASISEEAFKKYFERFGRITDVVVMQDSLTQRPRGFGFITFDSEESVEKVMLKSFHDLNGRQVEVKRAVPKEANCGSDGFYRTRNKSERGGLRSSPHRCPSYMHSGFATFPSCDFNGSYFYGPNVYSCWYPMGGYGVNGYAIPSIVSRNFCYGPMVTSAPAYHVSYASGSPNPAYLNGRNGIVGPRSRVHNGFTGPATNLKFDRVVPIKGSAPADVMYPRIEGVKQEVDSSS